MSSFWKRHRTKIVAATAVGAAGAAAAYYWWSYTSSIEDDRPSPKDQFLDTLQAIVNAEQHPYSQRGSLDGSGPSSSGGPGQSLEDTLRQHFNSIQDLSDKQALEDLLPRLRAMLFEATDFDRLKDQIRSMSEQQQQPPPPPPPPGHHQQQQQGAAPAGMSPELKVQLWRELARQCFTRTMSACWLIPLLDLLVRMKLHIVGRHMYLESKLPEMAPRGRGAVAARMQMPPRLSDRAKEIFFKSDYFIETGARGLIAKMSSAVERVLSGVDFSASMGPADVEKLIIAMHATFESGFERGQAAEEQWHSYLLPPGAQQVGTSSVGGFEYFMSPVEAAMVDELNTELRDVLANYRFIEGLRSAVRHTSRITGNFVSSKFAPHKSRSSDRISQDDAAATTAAAAAGSVAPAANGAGTSSNGSGNGDSAPPQRPPAAPKPFAYLVPIVAKSCQPLFDEAHKCTKGISSLQPVQALCASVFTCGPHIL